MDGNEHDKSTLWISIGVTAVAVIAAAAHVVWPRLKIDFVTVILLAIAALPWLRGIVSSVDFPGGASIKLADRRQAVARDQQETIDAVRSVATAGGEIPSDEKLAEIYSLGDKYEEIRATMPSGQRRTRSMGQIARQILSLMPLDEYDPGDDLLSPRAGRRLVAYLALMVEPDGRRAEELVQTLTEREGIPYNQSWALRALNRIIETSGPDPLSDRSIRQLAGMRDGLKPGLDRQLVLVDLVDRLSLSDTET
ncbi:MAG: hypothetical protein J2P25_12580 [Nocardiopsaceae bacterium]|nr:hypothetical protein [Nocardiopsaceae bacterium]